MICSLPGLLNSNRTFPKSIGPAAVKSNSKDPCITKPHEEHNMLTSLRRPTTKMQNNKLKTFQHSHAPCTAEGHTPPVGCETRDRLRKLGARNKVLMGSHTRRLQ
jgi:hypothetical protein